MSVFSDNPLLTLLGRRGRGATVDALLEDPDRDWTVRDLARTADLHPMVAARAVQELAAVGVVEAYRPGRAMVVRLRDSAATRILRGLHLPDLRAEAAGAFAAAYHGPRGHRLVQWWGGDDRPADPLAPARVAILVRDEDQEDAWEAIDPALDTVLDAGWPRPEVSVVPRTQMGDDPTSRAIHEGRVL